MNEVKNERNQGIIADYNSRMKLAEIAKKYGVHEQTVLTVVRKARSTGAVVREPSVKHAGASPDRNDKIVEMYNSGATLDLIGEYFSLTRERVRQILRSRGIERRNIAQHYDAIRERTLTQYGPMIDAAFDEIRSVSKVVERLKVTAPNIPARWIYKHLEPRRHESVRTYSSSKIWSDEDLLHVLRQASAGKGSISIPAYMKWREISMVGDRKPPTVSVFCWRFGSWRNATSAAGLASRTAFRTYSRRWSPEDTIEAVARYVRHTMETGNGARATFSGYDVWAREHRDCPSAAYVRLLTGMPWSQALRTATIKVLSDK